MIYSTVARSFLYEIIVTENFLQFRVRNLYLFRQTQISIEYALFCAILSENITRFL